MNSVDELIAEYLTALENGEQLDRNAMIASHPELAEELADFFSNHDQIHQSPEPESGESKSADLAATHQFQRESTYDGNAETLPPNNPRNLEPKFPEAKQATSDQTTQTELNNQVIANYRLLNEIDRGGMGVVYRAFDEKLQRVVALKMIRSGQLASESDVQRFNAEARAAAKLDHPGIVPIHEVGTHEGQPFFSMAFIEGTTLAKLGKETDLSIDESCHLIKEVAKAIDHAHENGLVHRDLKPANILVDQARHPRVTDFGLAKSLNQEDGLTGTGEILGTIDFMAPEQAAGKNDQVSRMTDVYALGAMLYFLCTGKPPFVSDNPVDTLLQILDSESPLASKINPAVPSDVAVICMRCLEKDPRKRYLTAMDLALELERYLKGEPIEATKDNLFSRFRRWSRSEPSLVGHLVGLGGIELTRAIDYGYHFLLGQYSGSYFRYTVLIVTWAAVCFILQKIQNRLGKHDFWAKFAWSATDIGFVTAILLMAGEVGSIGPLYVAYPLVIVTSGFFSRVRLVTFTTILCVISFLIVFANQEIDSEFSHYGVVGAAVIIAVGYVSSLMVYRIRLLNRLFE